MKKIILFIAAPVLVLLLSSVIIYHFLDINDYKSNIISLVKLQTGRDVNINGDIRLRILPDVALDIRDVSINSSRDEDGENPLTISQILIHLRLIPLLQRKLQVSSLKIINPVLKIHFFNNGEANYHLDETKQIPKVEIKEKNLINKFERSYTDIRNFLNNNIVDKFDLRSLEIETGTVKFIDDANNLDIRLDDINVQTSFIQGTNQIKIGGNIKIKSEIDSTFSVDGKYQLLKDFYELTSLIVKFDDIEAHGEAGFDFRSNVPNIKAAFYFENINLTPYADFIDVTLKNITNKQNNKVAERSAKSQYNWNPETIDFNILRGFNCHFSFKSNNILYRDSNIGSVTMNTYLRNGKFTLSLKEAEILGGNINGELVVDASSSVAKIRYKINLEEVDLTKLPDYFGVLNNFGGKLNGGLMLTTRGISQKDFVTNVDGAISLRLDDGYINGFDLIGMAKNVNSAFVIGGSNQKTTFKEISGDFDVVDGAIKTDNLTLISDVLDFNGYGGINLYELSTNFRLAPKIKRAKDEIDILGGIRAPILITGNVLHPSFRLEVQTLVEDLIKNPKGTENLVKQIKRDFEDITSNMKKDLKKENGGVVEDIKNILNGF